MGLFDDLICKYPLPIRGANDLYYQTKDTPEQYMGKYEIREDGTLWHEEYDIEDRSDPNAIPGSFESLRGMMTRVNKRWVKIKFTGEIVFYGSTGKKEGKDSGRIEWSSYFVDGVLKFLHLLERKGPGTDRLVNNASVKLVNDTGKRKAGSVGTITHIYVNKSDTADLAYRVEFPDFIDEESSVMDLSVGNVEPV